MYHIVATWSIDDATWQGLYPPNECKSGRILFRLDGGSVKLRSNQSDPATEFVAQDHEEFRFGGGHREGSHGPAFNPSTPIFFAQMVLDIGDAVVISDPMV